MWFHIIFYFFTLIYEEVEANRFLKIENGWSLVFPCKDNKEVSMLVASNQPLKEEFKFYLSIQGIEKYNNIVDMEFEFPGNNKEYRSFPLEPGQTAFNTELVGKYGQFPKILFIAVDDFNYCMNPDDPVSITEINGEKNMVGTYFFVSPNVDNEAANIEPYHIEHDQPIIKSSSSVFNNKETINIDLGNRLAVLSARENNVCGVKKIQHTVLITNGLTSKPGDWPWHAALYKLEKTSIKYICGGTLISRSTVLTAAHCVTETGAAITPDILNVILGKFKLFRAVETLQDKTVYEIIVNEHYNSVLPENDIALLKLETLATYNDFVQPACIWHDDLYEKIPELNFYGTVVGWGFNQTDTLSLVLQQATLPKIPDKTCLRSKPMFYSRTLNENNFCAGYRNGTSACNGDSGGGYHVFIPDDPNNPLSDEGRWYVHGIVSLAVSLRNAPICDPNHYVLFTDVGKYADWINEHI